MTISATAKASMLSQNTGEALIYLLTITSNMPGGEILYLCNNPWADITSGGQLYNKFYFDVIYLSQSDETIPEVVLSVQNVDRQIVNYIRTQTVPPTITLSAVLASTPNTVEMGPLTMKLRDVGWNALTVSGKIRPNLFGDSSMPGEVMSPRLFRGLF